jgi:hypothetical protein
MLRIMTVSIATIFVISIVQNACNQPPEPLHPIGPDKQVSMVVYFTSGTDHDAIESFWENTLHPGENKLAMVFLTSKQDHLGVAFTFSNQTTQEQRAALRRTVTESPIVYRVFENVNPDEIENLASPNSVNENGK